MYNNFYSHIKVQTIKLEIPNLGGTKEHEKHIHALHFPNPSFLEFGTDDPQNLKKRMLLAGTLGASTVGTQKQESGMLSTTNKDSNFILTLPKKNTLIIVAESREKIDEICDFFTEFYHDEKYTHLPYVHADIQKDVIAVINSQNSELIAIQELSSIIAKKRLYIESLSATFLLWVNQAMGHLSNSSIIEAIEKLQSDFLSSITAISVITPAIILGILEKLENELKALDIKNKGISSFLYKSIAIYLLLMTNVWMGHISNEEGEKILESFTNSSVQAIGITTSIVAAHVLSIMEEFYGEIKKKRLFIGFSSCSIFYALFQNLNMGHVSNGDYTSIVQGLSDYRILAISIGSAFGIAKILENIREIDIISKKATEDIKGITFIRRFGTIKRR